MPQDLTFPGLESENVLEETNKKLLRSLKIRLLALEIMRLYQTYN